MNLAAASEMDLAQASDMVTDYLSAFSMEASQAGEMADMMAYAQANSNTSTQQLGDAFGNCAANMNAAGQDMKTTTAFLEAFANQGVKGSEAGTKLSAIMRDITAKMEDGKIKIGDTSVAVTDANGNFRDLTDIMMDVEAATDGMGDAERAAALSATFTSRSVGGLNMILNEGVSNIADYEAQLENCDGAAAAMAGTMQNNLQGAITTLNSAAEGLGIALYDKVSGPLTGAVQLATSLISGLTDVINPQKTALEGFIEDIEASNTAVKNSLSTAKESIESGEAEVAKISACQSELSGILQSCEQFNGITLEDGKTQITDANGQIVASFGAVNKTVNGTDDILALFGSEGLNTEQLETDAGTVSGDITDIGSTATSVEEGLGNFGKNGLNTTEINKDAGSAQRMIGYVETKASNVETKLKDFGKAGLNTSKIAEGTEAIVELFGPAGESVGTVETGISDIGTMEISTDNISEASEAIVTYLDPVDGKIKSVKGSLEDLTNGEINVSNLSSQFSEVEDSVTKVYHITDEFTKVKIDTMVSSLGGAVQGLSDAWDSNTGTLTANREELEQWFDTAKQVAMYNALQNAVNELYNAWGESAVNVAKAQSAYSAALDEFNAKYGTSATTLEEVAEAVERGEAVWGDEAMAVDEASKNVEEATALHQEADDQLRTNAETLENLKAVLGDETAAQDENTQSKKENAEASEEMAEADKEAAQAAYTSQKEIADAHREAAQEIVDAYDSAKEAAENAFSVNPFDAWEENQEQGIAAMQAAFDSQIEGMTNYASNLEEISKHVGKDITPEFLKYLEDLGKDGANVVKELADAFRSGDTETVDNLMKSYTDAMQVQDQISSALAADAVAFKLGLKEFSSAASEWKGLDDAVEYISQFGSGVSETTKTAFDRAAKTAQECGVAIPQGLLEGIENGTDNPEAAVASATDQIEAAIQGRAEGLLEAAREAGIPIPDGIAEGIAEGGDAAVQAYEELVNSILSSGAGDFEGAMNEMGAEGGENFADGVSSSSGAAESAAQTMADAAKTATVTAAKGFDLAGKTAASGFRVGITQEQANTVATATAMAQAACEGADSVSGNFQSAGSNAGANYNFGIGSQTGTAYSAGSSVASSAYSGASSVGGWSQLGASMSSGIASGIQSRINEVASAAAEVVRQAIARAKAEADSHSPSRKTRDLVGIPFADGIAVGIKKNAYKSASEAEVLIAKAITAANRYVNENKDKAKKAGLTLAEAYSSAWLTTGQKLLNKNFGIKPYTVSKEKVKDENGDVVKDENGKTKTKKVKTKKSYSEQAKDISDAASKYLTDVKKLYDVTAEEELAYWEMVQQKIEKIKNGKSSQAWIDVTAKIKDLRDGIAKDNEEADRLAREAAQANIDATKEAAEQAQQLREETLRAENEARQKQLADAEKYAEDRKALNRMSLTNEVAYWQDIIKTLKKGTDEYDAAAKHIREAKEQIGTITAASDLLDTYKTYYTMSERAEVQYWAIIRKKYKAGTAERVKADKEYAAAYKAWTDKRKEITEDYNNAIADARQALTDKFRDLTGEEIDWEIGAEKAKAIALKKIDEELHKSLDSKNKEYAEKEKNIIESRKQQIASAFDLFAAFESKSATGQELLFNIQSQAAGYKDWVEELDRLEKRGILSKELMAELREAGPQNSAAIHALGMLSDSDLKKYSEAWTEKMAISQKEAVKETKDEVAELRKELADEVKDLKDEAAKNAGNVVIEIDKAADAYAKAVSEAEKTRDAALKATNTSISNDIKSLAGNIKSIAEDMTSALVAALTTKSGKNNKTASGSTGKSANAAAKAASATSLVKEARAAGKQQNEFEKLINSAPAHSGKVSGSERTKSALWQYIATNYQRSVSDAIIVQLGKLFGVKTGAKKATAAQKDEILKALKKAGYASGTRYLMDNFAWMDEAGAEMLVRRSDGARLNTSARYGDAVIPAANTSNLWEWSTISPNELISSVRQQEKLLADMANNMNRVVQSGAEMNARVMRSGGGLPGGNAAVDLMTDMFALMAQYMPYIASNRTMQIDGREVAQAIAEPVSNILAMNDRRRRA